MYEVYQSRSTVENYVSSFLSSHNLPLVVGEFGADHQGNFVDADSIMAVAQQYGIGYMAQRTCTRGLLSAAVRASAWSRVCRARGDPASVQTLA